MCVMHMYAWPMYPSYLNYLYPSTYSGYMHILRISAAFSVGVYMPPQWNKKKGGLFFKLSLFKFVCIYVQYFHFFSQRERKISLRFLL